MAKTVRMSDIAKELGVSTVTVSKALSDEKGVSEEMRDKIKQLAEDLGYRKTSVVQEKVQTSYNLGVLVSEIYIERYLSFYWEMYQAISTYCVEMNCFVLLEILTVEREQEQSIPKLISEKKIDGLFILGSLDTTYLNLLKREGSIPTVYMDFYDSNAKEDSVISNSFYGTYVITNDLFDMGHKDIAFVGTPMSTQSISDRYLGYMKSLLEHGIMIRDKWIIPDRDLERNYFDIIELPEELPSAFVCNCDLTASKVIKAVKEHGLRVPEDISVVGFDDYIHPGLCEIEITSYAVNMKQMAQTAANVLIDKIGTNKTSTNMYIVEGQIIEKNSTAPYNVTTKR